jgi:arylamine N-acetyltransferase
VIPADDVLEALDLSRAEPGIGFLEALFVRFNAKVPFENASKIARNARVADLEAKPRTPDVFWADHLELGSGGTCFARAAAFGWLLAQLGFTSRRVLGKVRHDGDHAALLVETAAGESIVDVGFPLPAILPGRAGAAASSQGEIEVTETARGFRIELLEGVPEGPRTLEVFSAPISEEQYRNRWRETFRPGSRFLNELCLRRDLGHRVLSYALGQLRVDDLHSRLTLPLSAEPEAILAEHFGIDAGVLARAFAEVGRPAATGEPTLTAYLETSTSSAEAFGAIATPGGYGRLVGGVAEIVGAHETAGGFCVTLAAPEGRAVAGFEDDVVVEAGALRVAVQRRQGAGTQHSSFRVLERGEKTYLLREMVLPGRRDELLRNDSMRGRLAGSLAVDLLAWSRLVASA